MNQAQIAHLLQEHEAAIDRHRCYVQVHETIMAVLYALKQQTLTEAQAIARLEEAAASVEELGLVALYRQAIERLRQRQKGSA